MGAESKMSPNVSAAAHLNGSKILNFCFVFCANRGWFSSGWFSNAAEPPELGILTTESSPSGLAGGRFAKHGRTDGQPRSERTT